MTTRYIVQIVLLLEKVKIRHKVLTGVAYFLILSCSAGFEGSRCSSQKAGQYELFITVIRVGYDIKTTLSAALRIIKNSIVRCLGFP